MDATKSPQSSSRLQADLTRDIRGSVRFDRLARTLYATDASIYEITPLGVVQPLDTNDIVTTVRHCRDHHVSIVPRGGGTGLAGGAVGGGVQLDCSRFMNQIIDVDIERRTARVGPGVVLDELNARLAPHQLHFAPDVATSSRATIGGMIANNSCGAHSIYYKRTVDHVENLTVVLATGEIVTWPDDASPSATSERITAELQQIADTHRDEARKRFPKLLRRNGGYLLDRLCDTVGPINPVDIICGSEGTLCVIAEATLKLSPLPQSTGLLLVHFTDLILALNATPTILEHRPAAVELIDRMVMEAATRDATSARKAARIDLSAEAVLIVEFFGDDSDDVSRQIDRLQADLTRRAVGHALTPILDHDSQSAVWNLRKRGLGLLMSKPGDEQSHAFVEDSAVDPARLGDYIARFRDILRDEGVAETGYYAHASVGLIHVRPVLNLKSAGDVKRMTRIADRVSDLALEFGGAMTGEHGDGIVRSCWLEKMYGPIITGAFTQIKDVFDPDRLLNPGKIVDPMPMDQHLRYGSDYGTTASKAYLDFSAHSGLAGMAEMCSGVGQCRQTLVATMCPSYMATGDETHTTRARANALRVALSNRGLIDGLGDAALDEVMDLCVMCKACKTECPTGVDMAKMKAEWLSARNMRRGVSKSARFVAESPRRAALASRLPRISNAILQSRPMRFWMEKRYGLDRRIRPPKFARHTFHHWFTRHRDDLSDAHLDRPTVVYFADTWTNFFAPHVGVAAVDLLEAAGFRVIAPRFECCGRPLISKGMLTEAKDAAERNIARLSHFVATGTPIVGTEPSCLLTLVDEYPQLVRTMTAAAVAHLAQPLESFLAELLREHPDRLRFSDRPRRILYHGHCHQKALVGTADVLAVLNSPPGFETQEINSGCCGMAGAFGHEAQHYDVAKAIGDDRLFPAVRSRDGADIVACGFSCRHQIAHHTSVTARHPAELLAEALIPPS